MHVLERDYGNVWSTRAEGLGVRALLRRFVSRAPHHTGGYLHTTPARESGGAPPHSKALRASQPHPASWIACSLFVVIWLAAVAVHAEVRIVEESKPAAVVVIPANASEVAKYAADELVLHLEKASGARLPIVAENALAADNQARIYIGNCRAAQAAGLDLRKLAPEAYAIQTTANAIYIAGEDSAGEALDPDTHAGTLWGVYEWLEQTLTVRWLWPGDGGTFVPKAKTIVAPELQATAAPAFIQRKLRPGLGFTSEHPALGFTKAAAEAYAREQSVFLRRHRLGRSEKLSYGHAFTDWWQKYGQEHPDWFQLREDGKRGPAKPTARFSMCVSNPGLHQAIVGAEPRRTINAVENDFLGTCTCAACRSWDGPEPADARKFYSASSKMANARFVSDRYAHFWLSLQQLAAQKNPDATVIGYLYFNYFQAPTTGIKLNPHVLLGYCPSGGFFPRSAEEDEWMKAQWRGWEATGARLFTRTNHLLDGYNMPFIFAHQFASDFQHAAQHGMVATDFDSLTGHWSTQGPTLYLAARLHVRPEAKPDDLLAEYYSGFGAAAPQVKAYFDYWEDYTTKNRERLLKVAEETQTSRWRTWAKMAHLVYPNDSFTPADKILARATAAVASDPEAERRVKFLSEGLRHAWLCSLVSSQLSLANPGPPPAHLPLLDELITFRRRTERDGLGNYNHLAWMEDLSWKLGEEVKKAPELYP